MTRAKTSKPVLERGEPVDRKVWHHEMYRQTHNGESAHLFPTERIVWLNIGQTQHIALEDIES